MSPDDYLDIPDALPEILDSESPVYLSNPSKRTLEFVLSYLSADDDVPPIRVILTETNYDEFADEFRFSSRLSGHVQSGQLEIRTVPTWSGMTFITEDSVYPSIYTGSKRVLLSSHGEELARTLRDEYHDEWGSLPERTFRVPAWSNLTRTLSEDVSEDVCSDFSQVLDVVSASGLSGAIDEIGAILIAAARNEAQLHEVGRWADYHGIGSRSTFSRRKSSYVDAGIIYTEPVPVDVGRPRQRLLLTDRVRSDDIRGIVESVVECLADGS